MTAEEAKKAFDELRAQGESNEEILAGLYLMFVDGKFTVEELGKMAGLLGYDLTDEFKAMSPEDQKTKGFKEVDEAAEGVDKETIEDAKQLDKDEKNPIDDKKPEPEQKDDGKDDEDEEKKARKLFGFDK